LCVLTDGTINAVSFFISGHGISTRGTLCSDAASVVSDTWYFSSTISGCMVLQGTEPDCGYCMHRFDCGACLLICVCCMHHLDCGACVMICVCCMHRFDCGAFVMICGWNGTHSKTTGK
jgi:hypothetical protein